MFIYPYKTGSKSVAALAAALEARVIRLEGSKFKGTKDKLVINWGNSVTNEEIEAANVLNKPDCVARATNKLKFFSLVEGALNVPPFTTDRETASAWIKSGKKVVVREILNGHSGQGIVLLQDEASWDAYNHARARMYVQYVPKKDEYRVHVVNREVIDVQRKAIASHVERRHVNFQIRNHANGYIYMRDGVRESCPPDVLEQALRAVDLCDLHFGAVDVIWNEHRKQAFVLEINTAPGLEGTSVDNYSKAFKKISLNTGTNPFFETTWIEAAPEIAIPTPAAERASRRPRLEDPVTRARPLDELPTFNSAAEIFEEARRRGLIDNTITARQTMMQQEAAILNQALDNGE